MGAALARRLIASTPLGRRGPIRPLTYLIPARSRTTTERVGRAMLNVARRGFDKTILESDDINRASA